MLREDKRSTRAPARRGLCVLTGARVAAQAFVKSWCCDFMIGVAVALDLCVGLVRARAQRPRPPLSSACAMAPGRARRLCRIRPIIWVL